MRPFTLPHRLTNPRMADEDAEMSAEARGLSSVGRYRRRNEDRYALLTDLGFYVVADGMGGHNAGEVAASMAVSVTSAGMRATGPVRARLKQTLSEANTSIFDSAERSPALHGMGTTAVALALDPLAAEVHVAHVGDSRCYRLRQRRLQQLTKDHSLRRRSTGTSPACARRTLLRSQRTSSPARSVSGLRWRLTCAPNAQSRETSTCSAPTACTVSSRM